MLHNEYVMLDNLLLSMSDTLDLAIPDLNRHQMRTAFIAYHLGKRVGLSPENEANLFIASLLHDVGALSPEEKLNV
jgi:HD-GYP domain-containing protein (c-di-GMP phosphodiesterase class II)